MGDMPCLAKNNEGPMLVETSMLTMSIERSICPLTMLVKKSMPTVRIERSICPLTVLVGSSMLTMRIQRASRLQCLSKVAFLQCVSRGAIPLACGRLEPGLWLCGRLNKLVTGPVAVLSENAFGWGRGPRRS